MSVKVQALSPIITPRVVVMDSFMKIMNPEINISIDEDTGFVLEAGFNFNHMILTTKEMQLLDEYPELSDDLFSYGVCDSPVQLKAELDKVDLSGRNLIVSMQQLNRSDESEEGGWRWHKWGPYIGTQNPQCEYLADEPEIETVFVYHIYEITDEHALLLTSFYEGLEAGESYPSLSSEKVNGIYVLSLGE